MTAATIKYPVQRPAQTNEYSSKIAALVGRLEIGFAKIDEERAAGHDVTRWEDRWLDLLAEYERMMDQAAA
jgi:hypothetical protein